MRAILRKPNPGMACLLAIGGVFAPPVVATQFPVRGTVTVGGNATSLPAGGLFGDSTYDASSGLISAGRFTLPQGELSFDSPLGTVVAKWRLSQSNTSAGAVDPDGVAALGMASMKLAVVSAMLGGIIPIDIGTCEFQPIELYLAGTASASGLSLADPAFAIPPVAAADCAGYGDLVNEAVAGVESSADLHIAGNFTPPAHPPEPLPDGIFVNGFEQ